MTQKLSQQNGKLWLGFCGFCPTAVYAPASVVQGLIVCPDCKRRYGNGTGG